MFLAFVDAVYYGLEFPILGIDIPDLRGFLHLAKAELSFIGKIPIGDRFCCLDRIRK